MRLTDKVAQTLAPPRDKHSVIHYDSGHRSAVPGFGLRLTRNGSRSWVYNFRHRTTGVERRMTKGSLAAWNSEQAREEAKRLRRIVEQDGDPLQQREDERTAPTVDTLLDRYEAEHCPRKRTGDADKAMIRLWLRPALGRLKVKDVSFADIDALHRKITASGSPYAANRVLSLASKAFSLAMRWRYRTDNPAKGVERNLEDKRSRYLDGDELARLLAALGNHKDEPSASVIRLAIMTGARRGEILAMRWADLDLKAGKWIKPSAHTKQKKEHPLPLSAPARLLLADVKAKAEAKAKVERVEESAFVFPGRDGEPRKELKKAWSAICGEAGLADRVPQKTRDGKMIRTREDEPRMRWRPSVRFHDLRHTYAAILASGGASLPLIGALLGHTQPSTTARYTHLFDDPQRKAVERVAAAIEAATTTNPKAEIIEHRTPQRDRHHAE
jgi:integrase